MPEPNKRTASHPLVEERRFRHLLETYALAIWETTPQGDLLPGTAWQALTGQTEEESAGSGWLDAVHPNDRDAVEATWNQALAEGRTYHREYRVRHNGGWIWTVGHAAPLLDTEGRTLRWLGMNVDISARKSAEHALREADRQKDEFISVLAHELRNPLAPLRSGIDLMLNESATSTAKAQALARMNRQTLHLSRLVDDLIDASRITTGKLQVHPERVRLSEVLKAAIDNIGPAMAAKRQQVTVKGLDEADPILDADPVRLTQAFGNVLNNSTKFSPEHSPIDVTVQLQDKAVLVTARDRGRAIPASDLPNIFKLFVQSARHDRGDGLGIGLALASDVIKLHGGTIEARSAVDGVGAEFKIVLPIAATHGTAAGRKSDTLASADWKSLRVLVVDDNADAAEALGALIEIAGHTIRIVSDGAQAVAEAADFYPDIIFMDVGMPVMDGLEATRRIRAAPQEVRPFIIALTGWGSEADRSASREAGCDMHMLKPAHVNDVMAAVERGSQRG